MYQQEISSIGSNVLIVLSALVHRLFVRSSYKIPINAVHLITKHAKWSLNITFISAYKLLIKFPSVVVQSKKMSCECHTGNYLFIYFCNIIRLLELIFIYLFIYLLSEATEKW